MFNLMQSKLSVVILLAVTHIMKWTFQSPFDNVFFACEYFSIMAMQLMKN